MSVERVGNCPMCGAPIYAFPPEGVEVPEPIFTCECRGKVREWDSGIIECGYDTWPE